MVKELKNKNGFRVPEGYFEKSKIEIQELIKQDKSIPVNKRNSFSLFYAVAASIVLLMVSVFVFLPSNETLNSKHTVNIELSDIDYYDINMNDLYYAYNDENIAVEPESIEPKDIETINYIADELSIEDIILLSENE